MVWATRVKYPRGVSYRCVQPECQLLAARRPGGGTNFWQGGARTVGTNLFQQAEMLSASSLACCFPISSCWHTRASLSWGRLHKPHWGPPEQINSLSIFLLAAGEVCSSDVIRGDSQTHQEGQKERDPPLPSLGQRSFWGKTLSCGPFSIYLSVTMVRPTS